MQKDHWKTILSVIRGVVLQAAGSLQLCCGQPAGCEEAVHAVRSIFSEADTHGVLLTNVSNVFNCLNQRLTLANIQRVCPALSTILINTYRMNVEMLFDEESIWSCEGTTQCNLLAMPMFAV